MLIVKEDGSEMLGERLHARAFVYSLAHKVFGGKPDSSLFEVLASEDCVGVLAALSEGSEEMGRCAAYAESLADPAVCANSLASAESDYDRFILGLGAKRQSRPWESSYTSHRRLLFQEETLAVRDAYRAHGYLPAMYMKVADDHIALECAFLAALSSKALVALDGEDAEELERCVGGIESFLEDHLLKWLPSYTADLREDAPESLYSILADALLAFARADAGFSDAQ